MKEVTKKFLRVHGTFSAPLGFARQLGCLLDRPQSTASLKKLEGSKATFQYKVPHTVCRNQQMSAAAAMAVFDELSTVGLIALDKGHRWGVSVNLSTSLFNPARPGDELLMDVEYNKMGKTLSFCTMELKDAKTGSLVATGHHTKYMPVSWVYDSFLSLPSILPIFLSLLFSFGGTVKRTWLGRRFMPASPTADNLEVTKDLDNIFTGFGMKYDESAQSFTFMPGQHHCNPMSFHGGAAAMAAEECVVQSAEGNKSSSKGATVVKKLEMTYLSAINRSQSNGVSVSVDKNYEGETLSRSVRGALSQKGTPRMLFEAHY